MVAKPSTVSLSGVVVKVGTEVSRFKEGDRVVTNSAGSIRNDPRFGAYQKYAGYDAGDDSKGRGTRFLAEVSRCKQLTMWRRRLEKYPSKMQCPSPAWPILLVRCLYICTLRNQQTIPSPRTRTRGCSSGARPLPSVNICNLSGC